MQPLTPTSCPFFFLFLCEPLPSPATFPYFSWVCSMSTLPQEPLDTRIWAYLRCQVPCKVSLCRAPGGQEEGESVLVL